MINSLALQRFMKQTHVRFDGYNKRGGGGGFFLKFFKKKFGEKHFF